MATCALMPVRWLVGVVVAAGMVAAVLHDGGCTHTDTHTHTHRYTHVLPPHLPFVMHRICHPWADNKPCTHTHTHANTQTHTHPYLLGEQLTVRSTMVRRFKCGGGFCLNSVCTEPWDHSATCVWR